MQDQTTATCDVDEASRLIGLPVRQVRELARSGHLPARRGRTTRIQYAAAVTWAVHNPSVEEAARRVGIGYENADDLATAGILPTTKVAGYRFVTAADLETWREYAAECSRLRMASVPISDASGYVYFLEATDLLLIKIGSSRVLNGRRITDVDAGSPVPLRLLAVKAGGGVEETSLHARFAHGRRRGEWFDQRTPGLAQEIAACRRQFGVPRGLRLPTRFKNLIGDGVVQVSTQSA